MTKSWVWQSWDGQWQERGTTDLHLRLRVLRRMGRGMRVRSYTVLVREQPSLSAISVWELTYSYQKMEQACEQVAGD